MARTELNSSAIPAGAVVSSDLTFPLTNFSSTGIDDNASNTAITINANGSITIAQDILNYVTEAPSDSEQYARINGAWAQVAGGIEYTVSTSNVTATADQGIIADTSAGSFTITLPASPSAGDKVFIADGGDWSNNNLTVARNGSTIEDANTDFTMDYGGVNVGFIYDGSTWQVYPQAGLLGLRGIDDNALSTAITISSTGDTTLDGNFTMTSTDAGSAAAPEIDLFRNSASPADADYLGQIKFTGKQDGGGTVNYAKITGKILDASNGTEDGILEFMLRKAGSNNIAARFRSDRLDLINGTNLTVSDGDVGVGTNSPSSPNGFSRNLTISGSSCSLALDETDFNTWEMITSSGSFRIYDETNERMRIDSSGRIGVGRTDPRTKFEVSQADTTVYSTSLATTGGNPSNTDIFTITNTDTTTTDLKYALQTFQINAGSGQSNVFGRWGLVRTGASAEAFVWQLRGVKGNQNFTDEVMRIDKTGTVSIAANNALTLGTGNGQLKIGGWNNTSHADIDAMLPGSTFGNLIEGSPNGHLVIALRENDNADTLTIVSGGGNYQANNTYDTAITTFRATGDVGIAQPLPDHDATHYHTLHIGDSANARPQSRIVMEGSNKKFGLYMFDSYMGIYDYTSSQNLLRFDSDGIKFGTSSAAANALDDYEEGTWTPVLTGTTSGTKNLAGKYTKIGNKVTVRIGHWTAISSGTINGNVYITGLPFAVATNPWGNGAGLASYGLAHIRGQSSIGTSNAPWIMIDYLSRVLLHDSANLGNTNAYAGQAATWPASRLAQNGTTSVIIDWIFTYTTT